MINVNASRRIIEHALGSRMDSNSSNNDAGKKNNAMPTPWAGRAQEMKANLIDTRKRNDNNSSRGGGRFSNDRPSNRGDRSRFPTRNDGNGRSNNRRDEPSRFPSRNEGNNTRTNENREERGSRLPTRNEDITSDRSVPFNANESTASEDPAKVTLQPIPKLESAVLKGRWADEESSDEDF